MSTEPDNTDNALTPNASRSAPPVGSRSFRSFNPAWPLWAVGGTAATLGAVVTALLFASYHASYVRSMDKAISNLRSRNAVLEVALNRAQPYVMALEDASSGVQQNQQPSASAFQSTSVYGAAPAPIVAQQVATNPVARVAPQMQSVQGARPTSEMPPTPQPTTRAPSTSLPAQSSSQSSDIRTVAPPPASAAATPRKADFAENVTQEEISAAMKKSIEVVTAAKAGIKTLKEDHVEFTSGRIVFRGETFPSGEKLLQVIPQDGRIITNQRQLIIFE